MLAHWEEDRKVAIRYALWCSLFLYGPIAMWKCGQTVYDDHVALVTRSRAQRLLIAGGEADKQAIRDADKHQFDELRISCAESVGANKQLENQNRDQQNMISSCQDKALNRLIPPVIQIDAFLLQDIQMQGDAADARFVVITNRPISPVRLQILCTRPILGAQARPIDRVPIMGMFGGTPKGDTVEVGFDAPAWTPRSPIKVDVNHRGNLGTSCSFVLK